MQYKVPLKTHTNKLTDEEIDNLNILKEFVLAVKNCPTKKELPAPMASLLKSTIWLKKK